MQQRGCYIDMEKELPCGVVREYEELVECVRKYDSPVKKVSEKRDQSYQKHLSCCKGNVISDISQIARKSDTEEEIFMNIGFAIIAGGVGARMNSTIPKQFMIVKEKPIIVYTLEAFERNTQIGANCSCLS